MSLKILLTHSLLVSTDPELTCISDPPWTVWPECQSQTIRGKLKRTSLYSEKNKDVLEERSLEMFGGAL
jgi:hypothetical protein